MKTRITTSFIKQQLQGIVPIVIILLLSTLSLAAQQSPWRQYFELDSAEGTEFAVDTTTIILNGGVPRLHILHDGRVVLGFSSPLNYAALEVRDNGRSFNPLTQISLRGDGGYIYMPDGRIRYITEIPLPTNTQTKHKSQIVSWISNDGLSWQREAGVRFQPSDDDDSIASVPSVLQIKDSLWRMYYVGDFYRTNGARTALSSDWGMTWTKESKGNILRIDDVDPQPVYLRQGGVRLYLRASMRSLHSGGIAYVDSPDGLHFDTTAIRVIVSDTTWGDYYKLDPSVIVYPNGNVVCYYGAAPKPGINQPARLVRAVKPPKVNRIDLSLDQNSIQVLPQPAHDRCSLHFPASAHIQRINIRDELGRLHISETPSTNDSFSFDCSPLPTGLYSCELEDNQGQLKARVALVVLH